MISDEVVIQELLKDAKKFKSKWELNVSAASRSKPNTKFLKRTLVNIAKTNDELTKRNHSSTKKHEELKTRYKPDKDRRRERKRKSVSETDDKIKKVKKKRRSSSKVRTSRKSCKKKSKSKSSKHRSKHRSKS